MSLFPVVQGFFLGASMIIPIGAQNAFILNQGIMKQYHLVAATICMLSDVLLIAVGIYGGSQIIDSSELAFTIMIWLGIIFLLSYGWSSFRVAFFGNYTIEKGAKNSNTLAKVVITCFAVTLLNPHVYIDTVIILGGVGGQFEGYSKSFFALGCMMASLVWFYGLALLAARLSGLLSRSKVKRCIDFSVAIMMWVIALSLFISWF
jgi:L-lysine exporter family protein LysE/ArgO